MPGAQGQWPTEHQHAAADRTQPVEERENPESGHPRQTPQRRMGRGLPAQSAPRIRRDCPGMVGPLPTTRPQRWYDATASGALGAAMLIDLHNHTYPKSDDSFMSPRRIGRYGPARRIGRGVHHRAR